MRRWLGILLLLPLLVNCTGAVSQRATPSSPFLPSPTATSRPTPTPEPTAAANTLLVAAQHPVGNISPYVYGANTGPWSFVSAELMPLAEAAHIRYLRFPGGNWGDQNDLRPAQIDAFIALCRRLGAEPAISVRLRGGTPEQAAELVRYTNLARGYHVRYWSIGNEPDLYGDYDLTRYNAAWRATAEAMLAVDGDILLIGPDLSQVRPDDPLTDDQGQPWLRGFLEANGDLVDIVAVHRYPFPHANGQPATASELLANPPEWDRIIPYLRETVREATGRDLPLAITEVNSHWSGATGGEATPDSYFNAVWWADVLGRLIRQNVSMVAYFALQSPAQMGGWGLFGRFDVRPTYGVYRLYARLGDQLLLTDSGIEGVSLTAARETQEEGHSALTIIVVNRNTYTVNATLRLPQWRSAQAAEIWQLGQDGLPQRVPGFWIEDGSPIELPPTSVTLYILKEQP